MGIQGVALDPTPAPTLNPQVHTRARQARVFCIGVGAGAASATPQLEQICSWPTKNFLFFVNGAQLVQSKE